jgi:hypothetical protein
MRFGGTFSCQFSFNGLVRRPFKTEFSFNGLVSPYKLKLLFARPTGTKRITGPHKSAWTAYSEKLHEFEKGSVDINMEQNGHIWRILAMQ